MLNVECSKCHRRGRYDVHRLIERCGIDAKLFDWMDEITADRPRKQAMNLNDMRGARCPDLLKVVLNIKNTCNRVMPSLLARSSPCRSPRGPVAKLHSGRHGTFVLAAEPGLSAKRAVSW